MVEHPPSGFPLSHRRASESVEAEGGLLVDVLRQLADIASGRKAKGTIDRAFAKTR